MDWLEDELANSASGGDFLVGDSLTIADVMMGFSIEWLFDRRLGTDGGDWPRIRKWFDGITARPAYRRAVEKAKYSVADLGDLGLPPLPPSTQ
jgi:glutathione S-transferase